MKQKLENCDPQWCEPHRVEMVGSRRGRVDSWRGVHQRPRPLPRTVDRLPSGGALIAWYRHITAEQDSSNGSSDVLLRDNNHQASTQALQLGFDFARAEAALVSGTAPANSSATGTGSGNLQQASGKATDRVNGLTSRIADLDAQIAKATASQRTALTAYRKELQSELDLAKEIQTTIQNLATFSGSAGSVTGGPGRQDRRIGELRSRSPA